MNANLYCPVSSYYVDLYHLASGELLLSSELEEEEEEDEEEEEEDDGVLFC